MGLKEGGAVPLPRSAGNPYDTMAFADAAEVNTRFGNIVHNTQYTILKLKPFGAIMYPIR